MSSTRRCPLRTRGQAIFYDAIVDRRRLTFRPGGGAFVDEETRTSWSIAGIATAGPLKGRRLTILDDEHTYWFIWSAFRPDTAVRN